MLILPGDGLPAVWVACGGLSDWILVASDVLSSRDISHILWVACANMTMLINSARGRASYKYYQATSKQCGSADLGAIGLARGRASYSMGRLRRIIRLDAGRFGRPVLSRHFPHPVGRVRQHDD
jgi:hypothetical protein